MSSINLCSLRLINVAIKYMNLKTILLLLPHQLDVDVDGDEVEAKEKAENVKQL